MDVLCCAQVLVIEGLHPFYDERVRDLLDFKIYLDISDDVKFAWKLQVRSIAALCHDAEYHLLFCGEGFQPGAQDLSPQAAEI
jgi:uridine kinase